MTRAFSAIALCCLFPVLAGASACSRGGDSRGQAPGPTVADPSADAELGWLQDAKQRLDAERVELAKRERQQGPGAAPAEELDRRRRDVDRRATELNRRLVAWINAHPAIEGEPLDERQLVAVRMKSDEDILIARQHIQHGGDYRTAIEIYRAALALDPANPKLEEELRRAEASRFMTAERFGQVKVGMTQAEVGQAVGHPNPKNVRELADRGIVGWFYPKSEDGAAAGVWFRRAEGGDGLVVYEVDFNAVEPPSEQQQPEPAGTPAGARS